MAATGLLALGEEIAAQAGTLTAFKAEQSHLKHEWTGDLREVGLLPSNPGHIAPVKYLNSTSSHSKSRMPKRKGRETSGASRSYTKPHHKHARKQIMDVVKSSAWARSRMGELKNLDTAISGNIPAVGAIASTGDDIVTIPQGDGVSERVGNKAFIEKLVFKGVLTFVPTTAASTVVTIALVQDKSANRTAMSVTDIWTEDDLSEALRDRDNVQRFHVVKKLTVPMNSCAWDGTAFGRVQMPVEIYHDFKEPLQIDYDGDTGAIGTRTVNNLSLITQSTVNNLANLKGTMRISYRD